MASKETPVDVKGLLTKARTQLLLDEAFFGTLALRLPLVEDRSCNTMWVDGTRIGYNPEFVAKITPEELKGVFCHEVLHVANGHCWRRGNRDPDDWNKACDYVINPILLDAGFKLPGEALHDPQYKGMPAEQVYDLIHKPKPADQGPPQGGKDEEQDEDESTESSMEQPGEGDESSDESQDGTGSDDSDTGDDGDAGSGNGDGDSDDADDASDGKGGGGGSDAGSNADGQDDAQVGSDGSAGGDEEREQKPAGEVRDAPKDADPKQLEREWKQAVEQAEKAASMRGNTPGQLRRMVEEVLKPSINWQDVLRQFVQQSWTAMDYSWRMPSTRYMAQGLYLPRMASETLPSIIFVTDTSMSIWGRLLAAFQAEVTAICDELRPDETYLMYCDAAIARIDRFEAGEPVVFNPAGGGGTDFRPPFQWVEKEQHAPACLVYLTDLEGPFPQQEPEYPVLWVTPPTWRRPPWGEHVEMRV